MNSTECPKCGGRMEEGFILDIGYGTVATSTWVEGPPESSFWVGVKTKGRRQLPVVTNRCSGCGFLESYAPPATS